MNRKEIRTGEVEVRAEAYRNTRVEVRAAEDGEAKGITGLGIPTEVVADIGFFTETIAQEAVTHAAQQGWDIRGLYNHDPNMLLGKTGAGTMSVRDTPGGMEYDIPELPASRSDVLESVVRGDLDGNSFSFTVAKEEWDESEDREKPHRRITQFGRLFDIGPVVFPANEGHTVVSARCMEFNKEERTEPPAPPNEEIAEPAEVEEAEAPKGDPAKDAFKRRQVQALKARLALEE